MGGRGRALRRWLFSASLACALVLAATTLANNNLGATLSSASPFATSVLFSSLGSLASTTNAATAAHDTRRALLQAIAANATTESSPGGGESAAPPPSSDDKSGFGSMSTIIALGASGGSGQGLTLITILARISPST